MKNNFFLVNNKFPAKSIIKKKFRHLIKYLHPDSGKLSNLTVELIDQYHEALNASEKDIKNNNDNNDVCFIDLLMYCVTEMLNNRSVTYHCIQELKECRIIDDEIIDSIFVENISYIRYPSIRKVYECLDNYFKHRIIYNNSKNRSDFEIANTFIIEAYRLIETYPIRPVTDSIFDLLVRIDKGAQR